MDPQIHFFFFGNGKILLIGKEHKEYIKYQQELKAITREKKNKRTKQPTRATGS
jgi:hypothetical protein